MDDARRKRLAPELARQCRDTLDGRAVYMWKGGSELRLSGRKATDWATNVNDKATTFSRHVGGDTGHQWFVGSGWQDRSLRLYRLAGEVTEAMADH